MIQYQYIKDQSTLECLINRLLQVQTWGLDLETTGLDPHVDKILLCQIGRPGENYVIDMRYCNLAVLRDPFFENPLICKIAHQGKFEYKFLRSIGARMERVRCTFLAEKVINAGRKEYLESSKLDEVALRRIGASLPFDKKTMQLSFVGHVGDFTEQQLMYAAWDSDVLLPTLQNQIAEMANLGLISTYQIECDALPAFADMEYDGIDFNKEVWASNISRNKARLDDLGRELDSIHDNDMFGGSVTNYASPAETLKILRKMGLKAPYYDQEKRVEVMKLVTSTGKDTLAHLSKYPFVDKLLKWRSLHTQISNFGEGYLKHVHPITGRIHPETFQIGAATGRISNATGAPNFLNIPREGGYRDCILAPDGYIMENDDYVTGEPKIVASLSGCKKMIDILNRGEDIYMGAATAMYGRPCDKSERPLYKKLLLAIHYMEGVNAFYQDLRLSGVQVTREGAMNAYYSYKNNFKEVIDFLDSNGNQACSQLFLANGNGRRRYWSNPLTDGARAQIKREGGNFAIQSVNADFIKVALARIRNYIKTNNIRSRLVNSVYDDILTCTHEGDTDSFHLAKQRIMEESAQQFVPNVRMTVSGKTSKFWVKD